MVFFPVQVIYALRRYVFCVLIIAIDYCNIFH